MAINVEALKARLDKLNRVKSGDSTSHLWKPDIGTHTIRVVPWPDDMDVTEPPFVERWFYYNLGRRMISPPKGEPNPVEELRSRLFDERSETSLALAKKLRPKMRAYLPIIERGSDDETTVKIWSINQLVYKQLISYLIDPDWGDFTDIEQGRDLTVTITDSGKRFDDGGHINDITVQCKPNKTPLFKSKKDIKTALSSVPDINEIYPYSSYEELAAALDRYVEGGPTGRQVSISARQTTNQPDDDVKTSTSTLDDEFDELLNS